MRKEISVPLLWRNGKMKEMKDKEAQMEKMINTHSWEWQNTG